MKKGKQKTRNFMLRNYKRKALHEVARKNRRKHLKSISLNSIKFKGGENDDFLQGLMDARIIAPLFNLLIKMNKNRKTKKIAMSV
jgi:hypothetical protein